jgi:signal transduction histidine kinase
VKLQQVFQNLLSNAIDFMDKPAGLITVACQRQASAWHFTVCDNGPGIAPRHFERIFQLFQTLATRDERERTGVGLARVKKIVDIEGGRVWVESTPGKGAAFHFTLPVEATGAGTPLLRTTT